MPRSKSSQSKTSEKDTVAKRPKVSKLERELNNAVSLIASHESRSEAHEKDEKSLSVGVQNEVERGKRKASGLADAAKISTEKHTENMRHKIAYVADQLIEEMAHEVSKKTKKDKEYLKGLTWSFGTLYDKLTAVNTEATLVSLPTKLLDAVKGVITAQVELAKQNALLTNDLRSIAQAKEVKGEVLQTDTDANHTYVVDAKEKQTTSENYVHENNVSSSPVRSAASEKLPT